MRAKKAQELRHVLVTQRSSNMEDREKGKRSGVGVKQSGWAKCTTCREWCDGYRQHEKRASRRYSSARITGMKRRGGAT